MPISLVLDIIIAVLLMLTIAYAVRLNQRLSQLRSDKNELQQLAKTFADATQRAEVGIQNLKVSSEALQKQMKQAEVLKDDLAYLVDRGSRTADEMVETVRSPRTGEGLGGGAPQGTSKPARAGFKPGFTKSQPQPRAQRATSRDDDDDVRLIEDAIRAATPGEGSARDQAGGVTRRISGRPANATGGTPANAAGQPSLASRGLAVAGQDDDDFEDTEAARELLKALSAVK